jgi:hypothetical protein
VKLCPYRNKRPRLTQGAYFRSHARSVNQCVKIRQGLPTDIPNHLLYFLHTHRRVQIRQGLLINVPYHLLYFLHAQRHVQKERGYRSMYLSASITFSTYITAYKKQGLPIDAPYNFYYFQHAHRCVQKVRGSIGMCSRFSI